MNTAVPDIHRAAGEGYTLAADTYVAGRPDYPPQIDGWLRDTLGLGPGRQVLDLGGGTSKFFPYLHATGAEVIAVEPVDAMRALYETQTSAERVLAGTAEAIPLPSESLDAVVCAQSFHWFANAAALAEIWRVLRPGGRLGLVWNVRDESVDWVAALTDLTEPHAGDAPRYRSGEWRQLFPAEGFGPLGEQHFAHGHVGSAEQVIVQRTLSVSFIAALPEAERHDVARRVRALIAGTPALAGRAEVLFPYETVAFDCARRG